MDSQYLVKDLFGTGINIAWYAVIICLGIVAGIFVGRYMAKRRGFNFDLVIDFLILAIPLALIGARVYYVAMEWDRYAGDFSEMIAIWHGGLAIYGGIIGGFIALLIFCKWRKFSIGTMADIAAPALALGQAIGRWGNFVNQEAFGAAVTDKALQWFPYAVNITKAHTVSVYNEATGKMVQAVCSEPWHMATFFYESVWNLIVFGVLMWYQKKAKKRGNVFVMYLVLYGAGRAFIEGLRTDSLWLIPGFIRVSQALALVCVVLGLAYMFVMRKREQKPFVYEGRIYDIGYKADKKKKAKEEKEENADEAPADEAKAAEEQVIENDLGAVENEHGDEANEETEKEFGE